MNPPAIRNNAIKRRYELMQGDQVLAFADYRLVGDAIKITHTEVGAGYEYKGFGSMLAKQMLDDVREQNSRVIPACEFIAAYIQKHAEYGNLVAAKR
ncbi:MAG: GNAT family N-acetyltransferase [Pseudomonadota bacterium]